MEQAWAHWQTGRTKLRFEGGDAYGVSFKSAKASEILMQNVFGHNVEYLVDYYIARSTFALEATIVAVREVRPMRTPNPH